MKFIVIITPSAVDLMIEGVERSLSLMTSSKLRRVVRAQLLCEYPLLAPFYVGIFIISPQNLYNMNQRDGIYRVAKYIEIK